MTGVDVNKIQTKVLTEIAKQPLIPLAPGKATEDIVGSMNEHMAGFMELLDQSPGITDDDKAKWMGIMESVKSFISEDLGASPGAPMKKDKPAELDQLSPEAGIAKVVLAL